MFFEEQISITQNRIIKSLNLNISFGNHIRFSWERWSIQTNICMSEKNKWVHFELGTAFNIILFPQSDIGFCLNFLLLLNIEHWTCYNRYNCYNHTLALKTMNRKKALCVHSSPDIHTRKKTYNRNRDILSRIIDLLHTIRNVMLFN